MFPLYFFLEPLDFPLAFFLSSCSPWSSVSYEGDVGEYVGDVGEYPDGPAPPGRQTRIV